MRLAALVKEVVDQRVRPAQRGGATVAGRLPDGALDVGNRCVFLSGRPGGLEGGRYSRGRYGKVSYVAVGW
jgi:hypothetical protein